MIINYKTHLIVLCVCPQKTLVRERERREKIATNCFYGYLGAIFMFLLYLGLLQLLLLLLLYSKRKRFFAQTSHFMIRMYSKFSETDANTKRDILGSKLLLWCINPLISTRVFISCIKNLLSVNGLWDFFTRCNWQRHEKVKAEQKLC